MIIPAALRSPSSLRVQLAVWYTLLLAIPLVLFAIVSYAVVARALEQRTDQFISEALTAFARELTAERRTALSARDAMRSTLDEVRFRDLHVSIADSSGRPIAESGEDLDQPSTLNAQARPTTMRSASRPLVVDGVRYTLAGQYPMRDVDAVLARLRGLFAGAIPLLLIVAGMGGYLLARRSLAPVAAMARQAADISASSMHQRLPVAGGAELTGLAHVVNGLLDRLEHAFAQQRRFVADASHELRTPTAVVRTEADVTLSRATRTEAEYRDSMRVVQHAAERLSNVVDDLFLLARADSGHLGPRRDPLHLEDVVHDAARALQRVASARGVTLALGELVEAPVIGDADLLGRLILNLLDNAIKYSAQGDSVRVSMETSAYEVAVRVVDNGPGIPVDVQPLVFDRFYRADSARSRADRSIVQGAGLGLAIVRQIATVHAGHVDIAESRPGRTELRFAMALAPAAVSATALSTG